MPTSKSVNAAATPVQKQFQAFTEADKLWTSRTHAHRTKTTKTLQNNKKKYEQPVHVPSYITAQKFRQVSLDYHPFVFDCKRTGRTLFASRDAEKSGHKHKSASYPLRVHASFASLQIQRARAYHNESGRYSRFHNYVVQAVVVEEHRRI